MPSRQPAPTTLSLLTYQRHELEAWVRKPPGASPALALRAGIVLACGDGRSTKEVAQALSVHPGTVAKWRRRYLEGGIEALYDEPRPGADRSITDDQIEAVIDATLGTKPPRGERWTIRLLAETMQMSPSSIQRIWRRHGIRPDRLEIVQLAEDADFLGRVQGVGLYLRPPEGLLALAVAPNDAAADDVLPSPDGPFTERLSEVAGLVVLDEAVAKETDNAREPDAQRFVTNLDGWVPDGLDVHVVVDHSATTIEHLARWLAGHLRFQLDFLPDQRWWLRLASSMLNRLVDEDLGRSGLDASIDDWIDTFPLDGEPFVWYGGSLRILRPERRTAGV
jgi:transposase